MLLQSQAGALPSQRQSAGTPNNPGGTFGEALMSKLLPSYYTLLKSGKVFSLSAAGANPTAFTGGAAGTPLIGLFNPVASGVDLVILQARFAVRTTGSAAANVDMNFWLVNQGGVAVTGTQTQARNMYSGSATGSSAYGMVNTTNTSALSSTLVAPSISIGTTSNTAAQVVGTFVDDVKGAIVVAPGCYLAYGSAAAMTSGSLDVALIWAEIPA